MDKIDFTKLISLNETAAFLWKAAEKQGEFTVASLAQATGGVMTSCSDDMMERTNTDKTKVVGKIRTVIGSLLTNHGFYFWRDAASAAKRNTIGSVFG